MEAIEGEMAPTLFGRKLELDDKVPVGVIRMSPETWTALKCVARQNSVRVKIDN